MSMEIITAEKPLNYRAGFDSMGSLANRKSITVQLRKDGYVGYGESAPLKGRTESIDESRRCLNKISQTAPFPEKNSQTFLSQLENRPATRHGLHQALLDLRLKRKGQPMHNHFGKECYRADSIDVNDLIPGEPTVHKISESAREGYEVIKVKVDGSNTHRLKQLQDFSKNCTATARLRIDFNESLDDSSFRDVSNRLRSINPDYLEQPFDRHRLAGHACLRRRNLPVALDESLTEFTPSEIAEANAADVLVVKPMILGGLDKAAELVEDCVEHNIKPVITTSMEGAIGRCGTIQLSLSYAEILEACGLVTGKFLRNDPDWESDYLSNGCLSPPRGRGNCLPDDPNIFHPNG